MTGEERNPFVERGRWKADVLSMLVMVVIWLGGTTVAGMVVGFDGFDLLVVVLFSGVFFMLGDIAQGWVWRRGRR